MPERVLGTYQCDDCGNQFKIQGTSKTAYDGWLPVCPECGRDEDVQCVDRPEPLPGQA